MAIYKYRPLVLDGPSIRLLELLEGSFGDDIQCKLIDGWIEESIPYDALSYTWGSTKKVATITVDGNIMGVTLNVYEALQEIRSKNKSRYLWIDAICIDQDNLQERGRQVQQMSLIYQKAERVVIWLGQGTKETDLVMDSMKQLHDILIKKEGGCRQLARFLMSACPPGCYEGMELILSRPWFRRIWILQEIANARVATVLCGKKSISASTFAQVPGLLGLQPDPHCQAVLDIMPGVSRQTSWWKDRRDLYTLLRKFQKSKATDERDIVYALLGISSDACIAKALLPDYEKPLSQVIQDTTSFLLCHMHLDDSLYKSLDWTLPEFLCNLESLSSAVLGSASKDGQETMVELLLTTDGTEVEFKDGIGQTPLLLSAQNGHEAIVKLLLKTGKVDVDSKGGDDWTPLLKAVENGHEAVVKLLLETSKVDPDLKNRAGQTPLLLAAQNGHEAIVNLLLKTSKVDVDLKDDQTPLLLAAKNGHKAVVKLLLESGQVDVNSKDRNGWTPLLYAIEKGHDAVVKLLLESDHVNAGLEDKEGWTPLSRAVRRGNETIVKLLLESGHVDVDLKDRDNWTPLLYAAEKGNEAIVKLLLETGQANADSKDLASRTPLWWSARNGHEAVVKLLLETGQVDANLKDRDGWTPLSRAAGNGNEAVLKLLYKYIN